MNWFVIPLAVMAFVLFLLWDTHYYSQLCRRIATGEQQQADRYADLEARFEILSAHLGVHVTEPVADDSPGNEQALYDLDEVAQEFGVDLDDTDEFPALPPTEPSGIPLQVQSALLDSRPVPRRKRDQVDMIERTVTVGRLVQTFRIRADREDQP